MTDDAWQWTCAFCNLPQIRTSKNTHYEFRKFYIGKNKFGDTGASILTIACQNPDCQEVTFNVGMSHTKYHNHNPYEGDLIQNFKLRPDSYSKIQPEYIPLPLRTDYYEACKIRDLSPKASATLSRRCIQGMIRDFCGITKNTLDLEIRELNTALDAGKAPQGVTTETVAAIDHVRQIGNIGAHMEKDINLIIDIDPEEASMLIELIEMLFDEWYVAREARTQRLSKLKSLADEKKAQKQLSPPQVEGS